MKTMNNAPVKADVDVLVVGGGNAALCAAITAREAGARVLLLESSPREFRGGNSRHTRNLRSIHKSANSFLTGPYLEDECFKDLLLVTKGNTDEEMARFVIRKSEDCVDWMQQHGVRFQPPMRGTLHLGRTNAFFLGGGKALINAYYETCAKLGVEVWYDAEVIDLEIEDGLFKSAFVRQNGEEFSVRATAVILASGGYQGNREWMRDSWGPKADNILVRGTPYDKGQMLKVMMNHGAQTVGAPDQGHCVAIDGRSPKADGGIYTSTHEFAKWEKALRDNLLISDSLKQAAHSPITTVTGSTYSSYQNRPYTSYGYGWFIEQKPGMPKKVYHTGDNGGFQIYAGRFPEKNILVLVFENRNDQSRWSMVEKIDSILKEAGILG